MRKLLCILFVLICSAAVAQGVPSPATPRPMIDSAGTLVDDTHPMPTKSSISSITVTVPANVAESASTTSYLLVANTPWSITSVADRLTLTIYNAGSETVWCLPGSTTAAVSGGLPIPAGTSRSMTYGDAVPFSVIASAAQAVVVTQDAQ